MAILVPSYVLPVFAIGTTPTGTEVEVMDDAVVHYGQDMYIEQIQEKTVHIMATEVVVFGVPCPLDIWIELSPVPSTVSTGYFSAIGGGGGALPPTAPMTIIAVPAHGTIHTEHIAWTTHSRYARVCVQTAIPVATALWGVQVILEGKTY